MFRRAAQWLFCAQLAALDVALRGPSFYLSHPRAIAYLVASIALLYLLSSTRAQGRLSRLSRLSRLVACLFIGLALTAQGAFFRYYHAVLDDQVVAAARFAWTDVRPIVLKALPGLVAVALLLAVIEHSWLSRVTPQRKHRLFAALLVVGCVLVGGPMRFGTLELRTAYAATSFAIPPSARAHVHTELPPLESARPFPPSVLYVVTESVRATDYCGDLGAPCEIAPEVDALLPNRTPLLELRSVSSYTAVSLSVLLTGLPQLGSRDSIVSAPNLFDIARALRREGRGYGVHYWSSQPSSFFERAEPEADVDTYIDAERMLGHAIEDVEQEAVMGGLDRRLAKECEDRFAALTPPYLAMVHFSGTHAPYFFDEERARFRPFGHLVTWRGMEDLHRSYQNSILEQDHQIATCIRAFQKNQGSAPHLVVLTSDHGESFGDHWAIHHGQHLYDEQTRVPGLIAGFNGALSQAQELALRGAKEEFTTHFDLLPTVLDALGILDHFALTETRARMPGRSLLRPRGPVAPLPITNCTGMWRCPLDCWGVLEEDRKLISQVWDGEWRCLSLKGTEHEVELSQCADLVTASKAFFATKPNGLPNR